jgi:hypothetical protein
MAALWWNSSVRELQEGALDLDMVKRAAEAQLRDNGFENVERSALDVAGTKNNCWVSIAHFEIVPVRFWEIVICSGDVFDVTKATAEEVVQLMQTFTVP